MLIFLHSFNNFRSRDYLAQERHNHQKVIKDVDQKKSEIAELSRTKEKLSTRVEQLEEQVVDLQEQVRKKIYIPNQSYKFT